MHRRTIKTLWERWPEDEPASQRFADTLTYLAECLNEGVPLRAPTPSVLEEYQRAREAAKERDAIDDEQAWAR